MWTIIFYSIFLLLPFLASNSLAKVVSCEGFVRTKISGIDLSLVQAKLFTSHGNLKYETECNAQNGHFLIPIYNKGHYVIRVAGPNGWIFEPDSRAVEIADDSTGCADDIVIELVGFQIVGNVLNEGGKKLSLGLYTAESGATLVAKTETDGRGQYTFGTKPGVYMISTMADAGQCVTRGTVSVEVINGPVKVQPDITLSGHNVKVTVVDEWGDKMAKTDKDNALGVVVVELLSDSQIDFQHLPVNAQSPRMSRVGNGVDNGSSGWLYELETRTGTALFACLPSARYILSAAVLPMLHQNGGERRPVGVQFERKTIQVDADAVEVTLSVSSFRLFGTVLGPLGRPIGVDGLTISLDGVARPAKITKSTDATADVDIGTFELSDILRGKHRIGATKEHFEFSQIVIDVSTKFDGLIELRSERIAFCGTVSPMKPGQVSVEIKPLDSANASARGGAGDAAHRKAAAVVVQPDGNGHFCRMLRPAKYTANVLSSVAYTPQQTLVDLTEKPSVDLKFTQFLAKISGRIECLDNCDGILVELQQRDRSSVVATTKPTNDSFGTFEFAQILPSIYNVRIVSGNNIWWDLTEQTVKLVDKNVDGLRFSQKGFKMDIQSTHPTKMEYSAFGQQNVSATSAVNAVPKTVHLVAGLNTVFFPRAWATLANNAKKDRLKRPPLAAQQFEFSLLSCHDFDIGMVAAAEQPQQNNKNNVFSVPGTDRIELRAKATLVPVIIKFDDDDDSSQGRPRSNDSEENVTHMDMVDVVLNCDQCLPEAKHSSTNDAHNGTSRTLVFRLDQQKVGTHFVAMALSARHLFVPERIAFKFDGTCQEEPIVFRAHLGKFIEGYVRPAIAEVNVTATRTNSDGKALTTELRTQTDANGTFRIGPVWDERDFALTLAKDGFEFKSYNVTATSADADVHQRRSHFVFSATKLSQLVVHFVDTDLKTPLADVLVSVSSSSSSSDFRSNTVTDQTGTLTIVGLAPGTYFIRPILKEYKFHTNSFVAQMAEGQTEEMILEAKRHAYSIYGKVSTISSKLLPSPIYVEALSAQCENHQEEDVADSRTYEFRVRGLKPSCRYTVFLKDESGARIEAFPPLFDVQTGNEDKRGINFVVFPNELPEATVAGELELAENDTIPGGTFRVLLRESATGKIVQEQIVRGTVFFFTLPAYHKHFSVEIDRSEAKRLKIEPLSQEFYADAPFTFVRLIPRPQQRPIDVEVHKANYVGLALILLITLAFLNQTRTKILVAFLIERMQKIVQSKNKQSAQIGLSAELERRRKAKKQ